MCVCGICLYVAVKQMQGQSVLDQPQLTVSTDSADDITGIDDDDDDPVAGKYFILQHWLVLS